MTRDYAVAPGEFLKEWIEEEGHGITQQELADRLGLSRKTVNEILNGKAPVTGDTAIKLERVTGIPSEAWVRYNAMYESDVARLRDEKNLESHAGKISDKVGKFLRSHGATKATKRNPAELASDLLGFVGCGSFEALEERGRTLRSAQVATLTESSAKLDPIAMMVWLRVGEDTDEFARGYSMEFDEARLIETIPAIRRRVQSPDDSMVSDVSSMLSKCGVVLVFVDPPERFPLHGVTRWLSNGVPVIQLTGRRLKDGFIIWALFHEIGHVLNDERRNGGCGSKKTREALDREEKRANEFAYKTLFGERGLNGLRNLSSDRDIEREADRIGVSPGVAVAAMHRRRMLPYDRGQSLLVDISATVH